MYRCIIMHLPVVPQRADIASAIAAIAAVVAAVVAITAVTALFWCIF
jgi:hypothetical protein